MAYKAVFISKGSGGWGTGLRIEPKGKKAKVVSITGGEFTLSPNALLN